MSQGSGGAHRDSIQESWSYEVVSDQVVKPAELPASERTIPYVGGAAKEVTREDIVQVAGVLACAPDEAGVHLVCFS